MNNRRYIVNIGGEKTGSKNKYTREKLDGIVAAGFDGVFLGLCKGGFGHYQRRIVRQIRKRGLYLDCVHIGYIDQRSTGELWKESSRTSSVIAGIKRDIYRISKAGIDTVVLHCTPEDEMDIGYSDVVRDRYIDIVRYANSHDIKICIENTSHSPLFHTLIYELVKVGACICVDTGHINANFAIDEVIRDLSPYIQYTHLHDNNGKYDQHKIMYDGNYDYSDIYEIYRHNGISISQEIQYEYNYLDISIEQFYIRAMKAAKKFEKKYTR